MIYDGAVQYVKPALVDISKKKKISPRRLVLDLKSFLSGTTLERTGIFGFGGLINFFKFFKIPKMIPSSKIRNISAQFEMSLVDCIIITNLVSLVNNDSWTQQRVFTHDHHYLLAGPACWRILELLRLSSLCHWWSGGVLVWPRLSCLCPRSPPRRWDPGCQCSSVSTVVWSCLDHPHPENGRTVVKHDNDTVTVWLMTQVNALQLRISQNTVVPPH